MADSVASIANEWLVWTRAQVDQAQAHFLIAANGLKPTLPPKSFFKFPPSNFPTTLPSPEEGANFEHPFSIPSGLYNAALSPIVPITGALVYITAITYLNSVNRRRQKKPWAISQTAIFKLFVLLHNIFLSLYSLWTFIGMYSALRISLANPREHGIVGTIDSLCKLHGPRGYGAGATYNERANTWGFTDHTLHLMNDTLIPDSTDVGRMWNEGLAFYGWIFYISKFYEVVDTLIIIAKGKTSSFLQTYHHAGAMLCMWAGIRYMSPPIWLFVFENSFIHFIMYAFYAATTLSIRVPKPLKQLLTTMQITQFVVGVAFAFAHYFVAYQIPVSVPYTFYLGGTAEEATSAIKSDASSILATATATASADLGSWLKKFALRAAGREGLAENIVNDQGQTFGVDAVHAVKEFVQSQETRYRSEYQWVHCLDTSGQTFAIYLNIFYLAPLTWLFMRFFVRSYLKRSDQERRRSSVGQIAYVAGKSMDDARRGVRRRLSEAFEDYQGANGEMNPDDVLAVTKQAGKELKDFGKKALAETRDATHNAREKIEDVTEAVNDQVTNVDTQSVIDDVQEKAHQISNVSIQKVQKVVQESKDTTQEKIPEAKNTSQNVDKSEKTPGDNGTKSPSTPGTPQSAKKLVENSLSEDTTSNVADTAEKVKEKAVEIGEKVKVKVDKSGDGQSKKEQGVETGEGQKNSKITVAPEESEAVHVNPPEEADDELEIIPKHPDSTVDKPARSHNTKPPLADASEPTTAAVQEGKSFADAVAEGVPEEDEGEVRSADVPEGTEAAAEEDVEEGA